MLQGKRPRSSPTVQKLTRVTILVVGIATFLCFLALSPILRTITKQDRLGSAPRTGVAIVEQIVPPRIEENVKPIPAQVWVRLNGKLAPAETALGAPKLKVGEPALVVYRIGRSGRIYVDRVEPMPAAPTPILRK